jgi:hypothetical protein
MEKTIKIIAFKEPNVLKYSCYVVTLNKTMAKIELTDELRSFGRKEVYDFLREKFKEETIEIYN